MNRRSLRVSQAVLGSIRTPWSRFATRRQIMAARETVMNVSAVPEVVRYAVEIVRATRSAGGISLGAGTRGAIGLVKGFQSVRRDGRAALHHPRRHQVGRPSRPSAPGDRRARTRDQRSGRQR